MPVTSCGGCIGKRAGAARLHGALIAAALFWLPVEGAFADPVLHPGSDAFTVLVRENEERF